MADSNTNTSKTVVQYKAQSKFMTQNEYKKAFDEGKVNPSNVRNLGYSGVIVQELVPVDNNNQASTSPVPFSGTPVTSSSSDTLSKMNFTPLDNSLNSYDQVAYHIKFSVLSDVTGVDKEIIIAESGASELNIQDMSMTANIGPDILSTNTSAINFEMTILEFYGASLMDRIIESATILKVQNYLKTPFKIEIKFMGRNADNGAPIANLLGSSVWGWKVIINHIETKVTEAGCVHKLRFAPISDIAGTDDIMRIPDSYVANGTTCGDILRDLCGKMTDASTAHYGGVKMVEYKVAAALYPSSSGAAVSSPLDHIVTNTDILNSSRNPDMATVSNGLSFARLVDILLSNSDTAVRVATGQSSDALSTTSSATSHSVMCRIEKKVEYGLYIDLFNDYQKTVTYILVPYDTIRLVSNFNQYQNINDANTTKARVKHMADSGFMKKQYDYIFTGKNTEVLNFDIDLTFDYYTAVQIMLGMRTYSTATTGQAYNDINQQRADTLSYQQYNDTIKALSSKKSLSQSEQITLDDAKTNAAMIKPKVDQAIKESVTRGQSAINDAKSALSNRNKSTYADDENYSSALNTIYDLPVTLRQKAGLLNSVDGVVESNGDTRRSIYAALLDQLYGNIDSNLARIELTIKGDPYWLGKPGYNSLYSMGFSVVGTTSQTIDNDVVPNITPADTYANYTVGENVIVLRYVLPQGFDESTGRPLLKQNETYTGFYSVNTIVHKFSNGMFTQDLTGFRIPGASVAKVLAAKTNASQDGNNVSTIASSVSQTPAAKSK